MASAFSHALGAVAICAVFAPRRMPKSFWFLAIFLSILPDFDVIGFKFGIAYAHPLGHRGFTHSISFALALGLCLAIWQRHYGSLGPRLYIWFLFAVVTVSHGLLDGLTSGGKGMAFFWPFDNERYFLPWRVIRVSPIGIREFFSEWGLRVIKSEAVWVGIPTLSIITIGVTIRRFLPAKRWYYVTLALSAKYIF